MVNTARKMHLDLQQMYFFHKTSSKIIIQKPAEATANLICNRIAGKVTKVSKNSQHINSGTVKNEHDKEIPKKRYVSPEERREIVDKLRLQ